MGCKAKWVPVKGPRTSGKGCKRGHKTEMRGAEEQIGREGEVTEGREGDWREDCRGDRRERGTSEELDREPGREVEEVEG